MYGVAERRGDRVGRVLGDCAARKTAQEGQRRRGTRRSIMSTLTHGCRKRPFPTASRRDLHHQADLGPGGVRGFDAGFRISGKDLAHAAEQPRLRLGHAHLAVLHRPLAGEVQTPAAFAGPGAIGLQPDLARAPIGVHRHDGVAEGGGGDVGGLRGESAAWGRGGAGAARAHSGERPKAGMERREGVFVSCDVFHFTRHGAKKATTARMFYRGPRRAAWPRRGTGVSCSARCGRQSPATRGSRGRPDSGTSVARRWL